MTDKSGDHRRANQPTGGLIRNPLRRSRAVYWTVGDQLVSSASNFLLLVAVAHVSSVSAFGAFVLAYVVYGVLLGVARAGGGEVLLLRAQEDPQSFRRDAGWLLALVLAASILSAGAMATVSFALPEAARGFTRALALVLPVLMLEDALRYCLFASRRPARALAIDVLWITVQAVSFGVLLALSPAADASGFVLAWGGGAAAAVVLGFLSVRAAPRFRQASRWIADDRARVGSFVANFGLVTGSAYVSTYAIGLVAGLPVVAALRGAQLLFGPLDSLITGVRVFALPALARAARRGRHALRSRAAEVAALAGVVVVLWSIFLLVLPDSVGRGLLGHTWRVAQPVLVVIAVGALARHVSSLPMEAIRALGGGATLVRARATASTLNFVGVVLGAYLAGAKGGAIGLGLGSILGATVWWRVFIRASDPLPAEGIGQAEPVADGAGV